MFVASRLGHGLTRPFRDTVLRTSPFQNQRFLSAALPPGFWGGTYTASDGENVNVAVSDYYIQDPAGPQSVAEFFATGLIHGPELAQLSVVVIEPLASVQANCGGDANVLACYDGNNKIMFIPGEDPQAGIPLEEIVAHEYGHHVALHSLNPPWLAFYYGAKRWASYETICTRTQQGSAFPGDEGEHYMQNPGEAFAETYRVLNDLRWNPNLTSVYWGIVDQSFFPDAAAIQAVNQDVTNPWTASSGYGVTGRFRTNGTSVRTYALKTPLDGVMAIRVRSTAGPYTVSVVDKRTGSAVAAGRGRSFTICGARSEALVVHRRGHPGRFTLTVSRP